MGKPLIQVQTDLKGLPLPVSVQMTSVAVYWASFPSPSKYEKLNTMTNN